MTNKQAVGVIKFEIACVNRQDTPQCTRDCKKCDLCLPTEDVLQAYEMAIQALSQEPTIQDKQAESEKYQKAFDDGYANGYAQARFDYEQEPREDAISREDAITAIKLAFSWVVRSNPSKEVREIFNKCKKNLRELPSVTQKSGKWIPVSKRLPEENETVLINYCRLNEHSVRMAIWDELHCRFYNSEYTKYVSVDFVTAWMPLPEPYEPQESEDKEK